MNLGKYARAPVALAYWLGLAGEARRDSGCARVLMLHGVPRRHAALLRDVLAYVRRHFEVVPLSVLLADNLRLGKQLAITFDDGLRNNVEVAYPILKALALPATFFVCPGLVGSGAWLWNHEARQRLSRLRLGPEQVEAKIEAMKRSPFGARLEEEQRIRRETPDFAPTAQERHELDLAGWQELKSLDPSLITIGSHTLTHPILPSLDTAALEREISQSRALLEERLQRTVDLFAYPNGDVDARSLDCVRRHYRAAVTVEEGCMLPGSDPHLLPRINVPGSRLRFALALHRDHFATPTSTSGSQVTSTGNAVRMARQSTIMKKNGSEARAT